MRRIRYYTDTLYRLLIKVLYAVHNGVLYISPAEGGWVVACNRKKCLLCTALEAGSTHEATKPVDTTICKFALDEKCARKIALQTANSIPNSIF